VGVHYTQTGAKYLPGTVLSKEGGVTYHVKFSDGLVCNNYNFVPYRLRYPTYLLSDVPTSTSVSSPAIFC